MRKLAWVVLAVCLTGCASTTHMATRKEISYGGQWAGRHYGKIYETLGTPTKEVMLENGGKILTYHRSFIATFGDSGIVHQNWEYQFTVDKDGNITNLQLIGKEF